MTTTTPTHAPHRRVAWVLFVVAGLAWLTLAITLVPWNPVPGGTPPPAPASEWFTPEQLQRAHDYATVGRWLSWTSMALTLAAAIALACSARVRRRIERLPGPWWVRMLLAIAACHVIGDLLALGFNVVLWRRAVDAGLSTQDLAGFASDRATNALLSFVVSVAVIWILIGFARRWRRWWPLAAGSVLAGLVVVGSFVYPVVVEPLFNDFTSLPQGELRDDVMALAKAEGVQIDDVLVADASRRTTTLNAYVSGFAGSRRVVLYDTLVDTVPRAETLSVVAHELAHAKHDDVLLGTGLGALGTLVAVAGLGVMTSGRRRLTSASAAPVLLALIAVGTVLTAPVQNGISRAIETRADVVSVQTTGDGETAARLQQQLAVRGLSDPQGPRWSAWWFGSHPRVLERIAVVLQVGER